MFDIGEIPMPGDDEIANLFLGGFLWMDASFVCLSLPVIRTDGHSAFWVYGSMVCPVSSLGLKSQD